MHSICIAKYFSLFCIKIKYMPANKNAILRYLTLDKCFKNTGRTYTLDDLLEKVNEELRYHEPSSKGIKRRQLQYDISFMESESGWSIELEKVTAGKKKVFRYLDSDFSINSSPLNQIESEQLKSAIQILSRFSGAPQFHWVEELIPKLEYSFGFKGENKSIISFDNNPYLKGTEHLGILFNAIIQKQTLKINYQSFKKSKPDISIIHPYFLKQYNNRWYLFGQIERFDTLSNRALDRIVTIEKVNDKYIENTKYDFDDYFSDIIGVGIDKEAKVEEIKLLFKNSKTDYILTKPIHESQISKKDSKNNLNVTIKVIPNYELKSTLLSFGNEVKVISPNWLDEELRKMRYE